MFESTGEMWFVIVSQPIIAYVVILFGGQQVVKFVWGERRGQEFYDTVGLPISLAVVAWGVGRDIVTWPLRQHDRDDFFKIFGFYPGDTDHDQDNTDLLRKLGDLSFAANHAFREQEEVRESARHGDATSKALSKADWSAEQKKKRFWRAHKLAVQFGYAVDPHARIRDFIHYAKAYGA